MLQLVFLEIHGKSLSIYLMLLIMLMLILMLMLMRMLIAGVFLLMSEVIVFSLSEMFWSMSVFFLINV